MSLAFWLIAPSVHIVAKAVGPWGAAAWGLVVIVLVIRAGPAAVEVVRRNTSKHGTVALSVVGLLLLVAAFAVVFPLADAGLVGSGSDRDDALDLAVNRLAAGSYPYSERTYLGNPVSPMPGAVFLAAPFALAATSALQNLFWLPFAILALSTLTEPPIAAVTWGAALLMLAPEALRELLTGGDLLSNGLYVGAFALLLLRTSAFGRLAAPALWAVLLGVALSSRAHLLLLLPPLARALYLRRGKKGLLLAGISVAAFAAVTLPFLIGRVDEFTPLHTLGKLTPGGGLFPGQGFAIAVASSFASLVLAMRLRVPTARGTVLASAWAIATPVLLTALASTVATRRLDLASLAFLLPAAVLASMASWLGQYGGSTKLSPGFSLSVRSQ